MDYEKLWKELKERILKDVNKMQDPKLLTIDIAVRFVSAKTALNTMEDMEKESTNGR